MIILVGVLLILIGVTKLYLVITKESTIDEVSKDSDYLDPDTYSAIVQCILVADGLACLLGGLILICI